MRNSYPALAIGSLELAENEYPKSVMAYFRKSGEQEIFVVHNVGKAEVEIELPEGYKEVILSLGEGKNSSGTLNLKGNSSLVFLKD